jgi:streptogramin lyase
MGSVIRIAVIQGGTRVNADGTPKATGDHLKGPFAHNKCQDRNNDGLIATSRGLGDIRPWTNAGGADDDECVLNYARATGSDTRTVAADEQNRLWTGGQDLDHELLAADGTHTGTQFNVGCGGYGGLIDKTGTLWSARNAGLLRYDPVAATGACLDASHGDYGLGMDPITGGIWHTNLSGNRVVKLAADGTVLCAFPHGSQYAQGVAVDRDGNVWVAPARPPPSRHARPTPRPGWPRRRSPRCPTG